MAECDQWLMERYKGEGAKWLGEVEGFLRRLIKKYERLMNEDYERMLYVLMSEANEESLDVIKYRDIVWAVVCNYGVDAVRNELNTIKTLAYDTRVSVDKFYKKVIQDMRSGRYVSKLAVKDAWRLRDKIWMLEDSLHMFIDAVEEALGER